MAVNSTQIRLTWKDNSSDEQAFIIYRRIAELDWGFMATIAAARTTFLDADLEPSTTYSYAVFSYANEEYTEASNIAIARTPDTETTGGVPCAPDPGEDDGGAQYEVVSFAAKPLGGYQFFLGYEYTFRLILKNPTQTNLAYEVDVLFRGSDGFVVERAILAGSSCFLGCVGGSLAVPAGQTRTFEDTFFASRDHNLDEVTVEVAVAVAE